MKNFSGNSNSQTPNHHIRERNNRKHGGISALPWRLSLRGYGFCMAALLFFCLGSLFYQLNGGPPKILLDIRQYLGKNFFFVSYTTFSRERERETFRWIQVCAALPDALIAVRTCARVRVFARARETDKLLKVQLAPFIL